MKRNKDHVIVVRLDDADFGRLNTYAKNNGLKVSVVIRLLVRSLKDGNK